MRFAASAATLTVRRMSEITPSDAQSAALKKIVSWYRGGRNTPQVFRLFGYAGTGKSTLAKLAIDAIGVRKPVPATFTGKAASVLRNKGNPDAVTFHGGMYTPIEDEATGEVTFALSLDDAPFAGADLIVADECSMIDEYMGRDAESFGKKILVMGDPGQLPPIGGEGYWTAGEPDVMLTEVHRQALDSPIIRLATLAREGKPLPIGKASDSAGNESRVMPHTKENQTNLYREGTQAICGTHRVRMGYTQRIRKLRGFEGAPEPGETLICARNNREHGIFNGEFAELLEIDRDLDGTHWKIDVQMEGRYRPTLGVVIHPHLFRQHFKHDLERPRIARGICEFDWGYVITCHKAQGSEWDDVTIVDDGGAFREHQHRWRYTALTRASKRVTFLRRM